jgi:hypothetical protein
MALGQRRDPIRSGSLEVFLRAFQRTNVGQETALASLAGLRCFSRPPAANAPTATARAMEFQGPGEDSIHQTQLSVTASLLRSGVALEEVTRIVLEATRAAVLGDPRAGKWSWRREARKILRMGAAFIGKHPELAGLLPDGWPRPKAVESAPPPPKHTLAEVHAVFRRWFGEEYDLDVIDAALATAASKRLTGDPLWLLVISGPGNAKTETVQSLSGAGAHEHNRQ